ncbi:MAG: undecaprenyl-diphosphate phosphatase [Clostridia bacterium]|nr:undecaprenyl-diphosphate phosphatase [Clostridia bacterium]
MLIFEIIKSILLGIVEGITEWLPISSTGHLILFNEIWPLNVSGDFWDMFSVVIQLGAIMAVIVLFFKKLNPLAPSKQREEKNRTWQLWAKILIASVPVAVVGIPVDMLITGLLYSDESEMHVSYIGATVIAAALIIYGIAFILIERAKANKPSTAQTVESISYVDALKIGAFQMLALIPGTSRSGSTIMGSRLIGISRPVAAEFSFFMAIPAMLGASLFKIAKFIFKAEMSMGLNEWVILAVGCIVSFVVSVIGIKYLMSFVRKHSFSAFGVYRIVLGVIVIAFFTIRLFV